MRQEGTGDTPPFDVLSRGDDRSGRSGKPCRLALAGSLWKVQLVYRLRWLPLLLAFSVSALAQNERLDRLTPEKRKWLEEEVVYITSEVEREVFLSIETLEARDHFVEAFWRRRDPNPATPQNEFKQEHYRRFDYANRFLGRETSIPGWRTDRGRMYIILGEPREKQVFVGLNELVSSEMWFYQGDVEKGVPPFFYLMFFKKQDLGDFQLYSPIADGPRALLQNQYAFREDDRQAFARLREISPELARVSLSLDPSDPGDYERGDVSLGADLLISRIEESATRATRNDHAWAWLRYGRKVASEYSFNFVPSRIFFSVLPGPEATSFVHYSIELDSENFTMETDERGTSFYTTLDVSLEVTEPGGTVVEASDKEVYVELTAAAASQVGASPFAFQEAFPLIPGDYKVTVILRNRVVKQYTVAEHEVRVAPIPVEKPGLSEIILGYRSEPVGDAKGGELRAFQIGGYRIYPAAEGIFASGDDAHVAFQVMGSRPDDRLDIALLNGKQKLQERSISLDAHPNGLINEVFPLRETVGGRYELRVQLIDPSGSSVAESSASLVVSPRSIISRPGFYSRRAFDAARPGLLSLARGSQLLNLKRTEQARLELEKALAVNPELGVAQWGLAWIFIRQREAERALHLLLPLEANFPRQYEVVAGIGFASYLNHDFSRAAQYLEQAMSIRIPDTVLLNMLGDSYQQLGRLNEAEEAFERSLELRPQQKDIKERLSAIGRDKVSR